MGPVAAFTDTYLPTVNGVTYTVKIWRDRWQARGGQMDVVFPDTASYTPRRGEHAVESLPFPFYDGFRCSPPSIPESLDTAAIVHAHTPFALGLAARRLARTHSRPLVASYHTPASAYASYLTDRPLPQALLKRICNRYERWFFSGADLVVCPSRPTKTHLRDTLGVSASDIRVVPNGIDTDRFRPVDPTAFRERYDLTGTLVGYTGRHGFEKQLETLLVATDGVETEKITVVLAGDGPARPQLNRRARDIDTEVRFLGWLSREELPAFYSALDVFGFPSPVETQGLVALEANACGTPVVGVDRGALTETIVTNKTGYRYDPGDTDGFIAAIERALTNRPTLQQHCLDRRAQMSVEHAIDQLQSIYQSVV